MSQGELYFYLLVLQYSGVASGGQYSFILFPERKRAAGFLLGGKSLALLGQHYFTVIPEPKLIKSTTDIQPHAHLPLLAMYRLFLEHSIPIGLVQAVSPLPIP
jgi:hypothetical protein